MTYYGNVILIIITISYLYSYMIITFSPVFTNVAIAPFHPSMPGEPVADFRGVFVTLEGFSPVVAFLAVFVVVIV